MAGEAFEPVFHVAYESADVPPAAAWGGAVFWVCNKKSGSKRFVDGRLRFIVDATCAPLIDEGTAPRESPTLMLAKKDLVREKRT